MRASPIVIGSLLLIASCARIPSTKYYVLELHENGSGRSASPLDPGAPAGSSPGTLAIGVDPFRIDPPYDQDRIVYRVGREAVDIGFYAYHRWAVPLSRMLPRTVADAFRGLDGAGSIEPSIAGRGYAARIEGRLRVLEEIDTPGGPTARLLLDLTLRRSDGTILWEETLSGESPSGGDGVGDVVKEMRTLLVRSLDAARPRLERALGKSSA